MRFFCCGQRCLTGRSAGSLDHEGVGARTGHLIWAGGSRTTSPFGQPVRKRMSRLYLFIFACLLCGLGGALGSMAGNAFGARGVWIGGVIGGLVAAYLVAVVARGRQWIGPDAVLATAL